MSCNPKPPTQDVVDGAEKIVYISLEEAKTLPGMLRKIVPAMLEHLGWYGCTLDGKRTLFLPADTKASLLAEAVASAKADIISAMESGVIPEVGSFAELHDHIDANEFANLTDETFMRRVNAAGLGDVEFANLVQDIIDEWIKSAPKCARCEIRHLSDNLRAACSRKEDE